MSTTLQSPPTGSLHAAAQRMVGGVRAAWRRSVVLRALVLAPALFAVAALLLGAMDLLVPLRAVTRMVLRWLPFALSAGALAWAVARVARPPTPKRLALLAEERVPGLGNRLVTALEMEGGDDGPVR
ncbi:MAG TPA: hypothetical protein VF625_01850, partial [Longimicrobium sp.]